MEKSPGKVRLLSMFAIVLLLLGGVSNYLHAEQAAQEVDTAMAVSTVNINTASEEMLAETLRGVGASKAKAIVKYRAEHGPFTDKAQLLNVKGIGEATLEKNRKAITL